MEVLKTYMLKNSHKTQLEKYCAYAYIYMCKYIFGVDENFSKHDKGRKHKGENEFA